MEDQDDRPITRISNLAMRSLSINTSLEDNLAKCHMQNQSPLYNRLPKEIRDLIFAFATAQYQDISRPYKETAFWYRPGHTAPHKTCTNLLLTCRRIWLETNALPIKQAVFTYWYLEDRAPPHCKGVSERCEIGFFDYLRKLTELNKANFSILHLFLQMYVAEQLFSEDHVTLSDAMLKKVHITIRHTDWWWWERDEVLRLEDACVQRALNWMAGVQEVVFEFETLERKKDQLQVIVDRLSQMTGSVTKCSTTRLEMIDPPKVWHWSGPANIDEKEYLPYKGLKALEYRVVVLTWKRVKFSPAEQETSSTSKIEADEAEERLVPHFRGPIPITPPFEYVHYWVQMESAEKAEDTEDEMQWRFQKMFADVQVRKFEEKWRKEGSLLKFKDELRRFA